MPTTKSNSLPVIFLSAAKEDYVWRERLKETFGSHRRKFSWWDDSRLQASDHWQEKIDDSIERSKIAVILVSEDYIKSQTAMAELAKLAERARAGKLTLFPILLGECAWKGVPILRDTQFWSGASPLSAFNAVKVSEALRRIAAEIAKLAGSYSTLPDPALAAKPRPKPKTPVKPKPKKEVSNAEFQFSRSTQGILRKARKLAEESTRAGVTSSCLLFAFADDTRAQKGTAHFAREAMVATGQYETGYASFMRDGAGFDGQDTQDGGKLLGRVSDNVLEILRRAAHIAFEVSGKSRVVHQRHLFAALLEAPNVGRRPEAWNRLEKMGINLANLLRKFRDVIRDWVTGEDAAAWDGFLGIGGAPEPMVEPNTLLEGVANYYTDSVQFDGRQMLKDALGIEVFAVRFARLISLRHTALPLSIGLFGEWGSGKSYFIRLLRQAIDDPAKKGHGDWCPNVAAVHFNAWHYLDTNLWASMVTEVFDQLFDQLVEKEDPAEKRLDQAKKVLSELEKAKGAAAGAKAQREEAEKQIELAKQEVQNQERLAKQEARKRQRYDQFLKGTLDDLSKLMPKTERTRGGREALETFDLDKVPQSLQVLQVHVAMLSSLAGRLRALGMEIFSKSNRERRLWYLAGALIGAPTVAALAGATFTFWKDTLGQVGMLSGEITGLIAGTTAWLGQQAAWAEKHVNEVEKFVKDANVRRKKKADNKHLVKVRKELERCQEREAEAIENARNARAKVRKLEQEMQELRPERRLFRFIEERAAATDYRQHLGLVSLVRRDFKQLSDLFTEKIGGATEWERIAGKAGKSIDRIVLYVDDLDRCQPQRVVEVLEAVHLLMDFRLFVAVVAVDPRWVKQSLRTHYTRLLGGGDEAPVDAVAKSTKTSAQEQPVSLELEATPLDYLEKIFHIPFHLPRMEDRGFRDLVASLTKRTNQTNSSESKAQAPGARSGNGKEGENEDEDLQGTEYHEDAISSSVETGTTDVREANQTQGQGDSHAAHALEIIDLEDWDVEYINHCAALVQTPRAVKRLINTYQLVRAGLEARGWKNFRAIDGGGSQCEIAVLLLAVAAGFPSIAREWFAALRRAGGRTWDVAATDSVRHRQNWREFEAALEKVTESRRARTSLQSPAPWPTLPPDENEELPCLLQWLDRVERFAF